jgi:O-antigen ligase
MKVDLHKLFILLWIFLSWGLIVISRLGETTNQVILKILIPLVLFAVLFLEKFKVKFNTSIIIYVVFTFWTFASIFYTVNMEMTLGYIQILIGNILIWYLTYRILNNIRNINSFLLVLGLTFLFHGFLGFILPSENETSIRTQGIYPNPNALGFVMWYGIVIFTYFYLISQKRKYKLVFMVILFFLIWVLIFTASRKSFLATIFTFLIFFYYRNIRNIKKLLIFIPIILVSYFFLSNYILNETPLGTRLDSEYIERSTDFRKELISEGISFFIEHPFIGIGLGSFTSYSSSGMMSHNDYIEILSSTGIIGLLIYMCIFWLFFNESKFLLQYRETHIFGIASRAFLVGYLILGMGRPAFLDPVAMIVFAAFQGMVEFKSRKIKNDLINKKNLANDNSLKMISDH